MRFTIRARLTLWYSLVMLGTLFAAGAVLSAVHMRLGLSRIDRGLAGNLVTATIGINHELDEGQTLREGAADTLSELELPGSGLAILDAQGALLGTRASGVPVPALPVLRQASDRPVNVAVDGGAMRMRSTALAHGAYVSRLVVWTSLAPFEAERTTVHRTLWLAMPVGLVLAAAGGWIIGWRLLAPLSSMAREANAIDDQHLDARLAVPTTGDELSTLATAFNGLLQRLALAFEAQRRFMADASHQLRTPLSIVRTASQIALTDPHRPADEYQDALTIVDKQATRLTRMVDDMFALALADLRARPLQLEEVYLDELVNDCVVSVQVIARGAGVRLEPRTTADVQMRADPGLIRQMVLNLLENAVRHTPAGGSVDVTLDADADSARITVADTGPGVGAEDRARIFERFVRLTPGGTDGGGGLGLPIARWIAQEHHGSLTLQPSVTGCTFLCTLPLK